jgi:transcriptional regulator with XRE-family HTH domain
VKSNYKKASDCRFNAQDGLSWDREIFLRKLISDLIRARRKKIFMTQEQLACQSGISYEHLNHVENYRAMPSVEVLDKIARSLGFNRLSEFLASDETKTL